MKMNDEVIQYIDDTNYVEKLLRSALFTQTPLDAGCLFEASSQYYYLFCMDVFFGSNLTSHDVGSSNSFCLCFLGIDLDVLLLILEALGCGI